MSSKDSKVGQSAKRVGRPKKNSVASKTKGKRNAVGRPKGDAAVINEYKARMLASPKSRKVLDAILNAALDDDHKNQAAAWKLCMDRLLPVSYFEKDKASGGKSAINISITGVGGETTVISGNEEPIEGEYTDV
ncbi:MAG: hypothetical protein KJO69_05705 [Gammaproteobacteria bacterium]|nr:hypothetical protein [Gammaproteobacteria bacterium]